MRFSVFRCADSARCLEGELGGCAAGRDGLLCGRCLPGLGKTGLNRRILCFRIGRLGEVWKLYSLALCIGLLTAANPLFIESFNIILLTADLRKLLWQNAWVYTSKREATFSKQCHWTGTTNTDFSQT